MGYRRDMLPSTTTFLTPASGTRQGFRPDPKVQQVVSIEVSLTCCEVLGFAEITSAHQRIIKGCNLRPSVAIKNLSSYVQSWSWFTQFVGGCGSGNYSPQLRRITDISCFRCHPINLYNNYTRFVQLFQVRNQTLVAIRLLTKQTIDKLRG